MSARKHSQHPQYQRPGAARGVAAIELFLLMPIFVMMLALPLYMGRYCYHYSAAHAAATSAAQYLSKIPLSEMTNTTRAPIVTAVAREIAGEMLAELKPGLGQPSVAIDCGSGLPCMGVVKPAFVTVHVQMVVADFFFPKRTQLRLPIVVSVRLPYIGR